MEPEDPFEKLNDYEGMSIHDLAEARWVSLFMTVTTYGLGILAISMTAKLGWWMPIYVTGVLWIFAVAGKVARDLVAENREISRRERK